MENNHIEPPPFKGNNETAAATDTATPNNDTMPELAELNLDENTSRRIREMLSNAETQGYLRGRNEKIEATQHFEQDSTPVPEHAGFPVYNRRSIWD